MRLELLFLVLSYSNHVSGNSVIGVSIRNINDECGITGESHPVTLGTHMPSLILQRNKGVHRYPCSAYVNVLTESRLATPFRFYIKVTALSLPRKPDGTCYHSLKIRGIENVDRDHFDVELCGELEELERTEFVSVDHDIEVLWNAKDDSDRALTSRGLNEGFLKIVITTFTEPTPPLGCPNDIDPQRPETSFRYHQCANDRCIDARLRCNRFNNCGDSEASDEHNCSYDERDGLLYKILGIVIGGTVLSGLLVYCLFCKEYDADSECDVKDERSVGEADGNLELEPMVPSPTQDPRNVSGDDATSDH